MDRRNVEVDPSELERHFDTVNSRSSSNLDSSRRDRYRQGDDEFGAVESKSTRVTGHSSIYREPS